MTRTVLAGRILKPLTLALLASCASAAVVQDGREQNQCEAQADEATQEIGRGIVALAELLRESNAGAAGPVAAEAPKQARGALAGIFEGTRKLVDTCRLLRDDVTPRICYRVPRLAFELESDLQRLHLASAHDARAALALSAATLDRLARALMGSHDGDEPEHFAPGQFRAMTDAEKLSKPAYEVMRAGCVLSSAG